MPLTTAWCPCISLQGTLQYSVRFCVLLVQATSLLLLLLLLLLLGSLFLPCQWLLRCNRTKVLELLQVIRANANVVERRVLLDSEELLVTSQKGTKATVAALEMAIELRIRGGKTLSKCCSEHLIRR